MEAGKLNTTLPRRRSGPMGFEVARAGVRDCATAPALLFPAPLPGGPLAAKVREGRATREGSATAPPRTGFTTAPLPGPDPGPWDRLPALPLPGRDLAPPPPLASRRLGTALPGRGSFEDDFAGDGGAWAAGTSCAPWPWPSARSPCPCPCPGGAAACGTGSLAFTGPRRAPRDTNSAALMGCRPRELP